MAAGKTVFIPVPGLDGILARSGQIHDSMQETGDKMAAIAKSKVPVLTGATQASIEGGAVLEGGVWVARASAGTDYAGYIEYGTSDTPSVPFMRPALDEAL